MSKQRSKADLKPVDAAKAALAKVEEAAVSARVELEYHQDELARLEEASGRRLFAARLDADEDEEARITGELDAVRKDIEVSQRIVAAAGAAVRDAVRDVQAAEAAAIRADVAKRWPAIRDRLDAAAELLDQLRETEHTGFIPSPWIQPSGAVGAGSWQRTRTGELLAEVLELERRAVALESRAGTESPPTILAGRADIGLHLGNMGVIESPIQLKVHGSRLDDASAVLAGKPAPETPNPSRDEIARQAVTLRR